MICRKIPVSRWVCAIIAGAITSGAHRPVSGQSDISGPATESLKPGVILVTGSPGTEEYGQRFAEWAGRWKTAAENADAQVSLIGSGLNSDVPASESPGTKSDLETLREAISTQLAASDTEPLWIVFIGHGTFDGRTARWNLRGPDVSAEELAAWCQPGRRPLAILCCCSCSSPFMNALSGPNRIVVTATKDGNQMQYSRFGDALSQAVSTLDGDINRDGETSLLEAWLFASRRTAEFYKTEGRLATEHSLLDDNGDSLGSRAEAWEGDRPAKNAADSAELDGKAASRWVLVHSAAERQLTLEQRKLRDELEGQLEALKAIREATPEDEYFRKLEVILRRIAEIYAAAEPADLSPVSPEPPVPNTNPGTNPPSN